jgi:hypothetical protein
MIGLAQGGMKGEERREEKRREEKRRKGKWKGIGRVITYLHGPPQYSGSAPGIQGC